MLRRLSVQFLRMDIPSWVHDFFWVSDRVLVWVSDGFPVWERWVLRADYCSRDHVQARFSRIQLGWAFLMLSGGITHGIIRVLDWLAAHALPPDGAPSPQHTGRRGEEAAYFDLRKLGYT